MYFENKIKNTRSQEIIAEYNEVSESVQQCAVNDPEALLWLKRLRHRFDPKYTLRDLGSDPVGNILFLAQSEAECKEKLAEKIAIHHDLPADSSSYIVEKVVAAMKLGKVDPVQEIETMLKQIEISKFEQSQHDKKVSDISGTSYGER